MYYETSKKKKHTQGGTERQRKIQKGAAGRSGQGSVVARALRHALGEPAPVQRKKGQGNALRVW